MIRVSSYVSLVRPGLTLVELVVVILILGVLAGIAAANYLDCSKIANDAGVMESLSVVRNAIDLFNAKTGRLPGADGNEATFKSDIAPYIRKFPAFPVGPGRARNDSVVMDAAHSPINGEHSPRKGWRYYYNRGVFIPNLDKKTKIDKRIEYDQL